MGRKKKHKIKQLLPNEIPWEDPISLEENSFEIFKQALEETDWQKVAKDKEPDKDKKRTKSKGKSQLTETIDLHGLTLEKAKEAICLQIAEALQSKNDTLTLKIITGKGKRSIDGKAVLAKEIPEYVKRKWRLRIISCDESPANLNLNGQLLRGHFTVKLKIKG